MGNTICSSTKQKNNKAQFAQNQKLDIVQSQENIQLQQQKIVRKIQINEIIKQPIQNEQQNQQIQEQQQIKIEQNEQIVNQKPHQITFGEESINEQKFKQDQKDNDNGECFDIDAQMGEITERLHLNIFPKYDTIISKEETQTLQILLQIETVKYQIEQLKTNIDLCCVVDVSQSMQGEKLILVQNSLRHIQKILSPYDRLSIVTFNTCANVTLPWTFNNQSNKQRIKQKILQMKAEESTNISEGIQLGLEMIKNQRGDLQDRVIIMFLLSDGVDDNEDALQRCQRLIQIYKIKETFTISTFGFGIDHDVETLNNIANLKNGNFAYIQDIQRISEYFILSISGMQSLYAKNIFLTIEENMKYPISKIYGDINLWKKINNNQYEFFINYLSDQISKEFVLEIQIPQYDKIQVTQDQVLKAQITGEIIKFNKQFYKDNQLILKFSQQYFNQQINENVEINCLRAKAGEIIGICYQLARNNNYYQAQNLLQQIKFEIIQTQVLLKQQNSILNKVLKDIELVMEVCQFSVFEKEGAALMINKQRNHIQHQRSINNSMEWNDGEERSNMRKYRQGNLALSAVDIQDSYQRDISISQGNDNSISQIASFNEEELKNEVKNSSFLDDESLEDLF